MTSTSVITQDKSTEEINAMMVKFLPELASTYASYPMDRERWHEPGQDKFGFRGEPIYLREWKSGLKADYVYGGGPLGNGYYSLLTRVAYDNLYSRIENMCPTSCRGVSAKQRKVLNDWDDVRRLVLARSRGSRPNDEVCAEEAMSDKNFASM